VDFVEEVGFWSALVGTAGLSEEASVPLADMAWTGSGMILANLRRFWAGGEEERVFGSIRAA
jgi:hypothetical protein